jgi:hypothetical protein
MCSSPGTISQMQPLPWNSLVQSYDSCLLQNGRVNSRKQFALFGGWDDAIVLTLSPMFPRADKWMSKVLASDDSLFTIGANGMDGHVKAVDFLVLHYQRGRQGHCRRPALWDVRWSPWYTGPSVFTVSFLANKYNSHTSTALFSS